MPRQLVLIKDPRRNSKLWWIQKQSVYGGSLNYRKVRRPFDSKKLVHAVFKAQLGEVNRFTKSETPIRRVLASAAARYGIKIIDTAIHHNHIHLIFYTKSRQAYSLFLRLFSAEVGRWHARRGRRLGWKTQPLWISRPFTRLASWSSKSLNQVKNHLLKNKWESLGFIDYKPRRHSLTIFMKLWSRQRELSSA